ncbi:O-acetyl-ADP-ribose deacetylase [Rhodococcus sp. Z13]|uniref:O-acetyl-ADP-ribose deacetylase n=1 Tax=Rhodococcus sacchari TaxID=2962047 RepID=A0ACD4DJU3_9NOCA|nr:O-acetyl-ADP-ribose deacetylase [Rhodococcus sp. Z13]UYP20287.1 O-acetyl-ADP-ribose deacetylase [Rhodococcus sp. Z13]
MTALDIAHGDITTIAVDAIVNAANSSLLGGGGVDGAIHSAGGPEVLEACRELRATQLPDGLTPGRAVATTAGRLPARWVIHTVGPVWSRNEDRSHILEAAYRNSLLVAHDLGARTVSFPLISAGIYGWPVDDAALRAVTALRGTQTSVETVVLVGYDLAAVDALRRAVAQA